MSFLQPFGAPPQKCISCEYGGKHCLGKAPGGCACSCREHTLEADDFRMDMIALMTAEAHNEFELLMTLIADLDLDRLRSVTMLFIKYTAWMMRTAGLDPVQAVQEAALYWSGGEPDEDESGG